MLWAKTSSKAAKDVLIHKNAIIAAQSDGFATFPSRFLCATVPNSLDTRTVFCQGKALRHRRGPR
jgi:hypothetical protein